MKLMLSQPNLAEVGGVGLILAVIRERERERERFISSDTMYNNSLVTTNYRVTQLNYLH